MQLYRKSALARFLWTSAFIALNARVSRPSLLLLLLLLPLRRNSRESHSRGREGGRVEEEDEDEDDDPLVLEPYPIYLSMSSKIMNKRKTIYLAFPLPPPFFIW
jgi:hypothetical protein